MSLAVDQLELGPIGTNTYLVRASEAARDAVVVDPSGDAATILRALDAVGARCAAIFVTHGHFDHIVSLADLAERSGAPVYAPAGERILIEEPDTFTPPGLTIRAATADVWLDGGETIDAAGITFAVTAVPGHSPAHLAYFADGELFSGDVLFAGSVGRTDFPGSDWEHARVVDRDRCSTRTRRRRSSIPVTVRRRPSGPSWRRTRSSRSLRAGRSGA